MKQGQKLSVGIIGAGISGLTAGALLAHRGHAVTVFEREPYLGGRALSFDAGSLSLAQYQDLLCRFKMHLPFSEPDVQTIFSQQMLKGYTLDLGYHAIGGGVLSNLNSVLRELGGHLDSYESSVGFIREDGYDFPFLTRGDKLRILPNIFKLLFVPERTLRKLDSVTITQTIERYGKGKMKHILEIFSRSISTVNNLDRISTGEMFRAQRNLLRGSKPVGYPKRGLGSIHANLAAALSRDGGTILLNTPVTKILTKGSTATGLETKGHRYDFDVVVSTSLVQELFGILDERLVPPSYATMLKSLTGTGSLCGYHAVDRIPPELLGKTFHFLERDIGVDGNDAVGMIDFMSAMPEAGLSPPSQYIIQSYIICTPSEACDAALLPTLRAALDKNLSRLYPDYRSHQRWAMYPAISHLDGVAKTIDNPKPEITTPITNLYLIGDCVKAPGIGINCAINSARELADRLDANHLP